MSTPNPLELAGRMTRKSAQLFRAINRPGFALFWDVGADAVAEARQTAAQAEQADREAGDLLDQVLADGHVTAGEVQMLARARRAVRRSATLDRQLATGGVS